MLRMQGAGSRRDREALTTSAISETWRRTLVSTVFTEGDEVRDRMSWGPDGPEALDIPG